MFFMVKLYNIALHFKKSSFTLLFLLTPIVSCLRFEINPSNINST